LAAEVFHADHDNYYILHRSWTNELYFTKTQKGRT